MPHSLLHPSAYKLLTQLNEENFLKKWHREGKGGKYLYRVAQISATDYFVDFNGTGYVINGIDNLSAFMDLAKEEFDKMTSPFFQFGDPELFFANSSAVINTFITIYNLNLDFTKVSTIKELDVLLNGDKIIIEDEYIPLVGVIGHFFIVHNSRTRWVVTNTGFAISYTAVPGSKPFLISPVGILEKELKNKKAGKDIFLFRSVSQDLRKLVGPFDY